ncbi:MAG: hypothetical protein ACOX41_08665 [Anaerovoracaceae bacterium]|jgi:hypothetical protein
MKKKLLAIALCLSLVCCFAACGSSESSDTAGDNQSSVEENADTADDAEDYEDSEEDVDEDVDEVEVQNKDLPGGTYVVGEDLSAGKYYITYKTEKSEEDYWGLDYFWITREGSKGREETLDGTKYDERVGGFDYTEAKKGKKSYVNLKDGDKITVDAEEGNWTY